MTIRTEREYREALNELETLMGAPKGTPEAARRDELVAQLRQFQRTHDVSETWRDLNSGNPWSEMDLWDLRNNVRRSVSMEETAEFLCRDIEEVRRKIEELQKQDPPWRDVPDPPH